MADDEWRNSRRALVALVRQKLNGGAKPRQPKFSPIIKPTDNWNFSPVHYERIGDENGHGYIPGDIYANCLWYWTKARNVVAAPMAGSGQIMRVYDDRAVWAAPKPWKLDIRMFDLTPRGPYAKRIRTNDLTVGLPIKRANYIVLDVPYFGMANNQYSDKKTDLSNMNETGWARAIKAIARSCSRAQKSGDFCTVISPNYRSLKDGRIFLANTVIRAAFLTRGYQLHDLAYASRRIQQSQHVGMAMLNNAAKSGRVMLTDIAEIMTFRRRR